MDQRGSVQLANSSLHPVQVIIEPWAIEFTLPSRSFCEVVSVGGTAPIDIEVDDDEHGFTFWINTSGAIYEYWQDGLFVE